MSLRNIRFGLQPGDQVRRILGADTQTIGIVVRERGAYADVRWPDGTITNHKNHHSTASPKPRHRRQKTSDEPPFVGRNIPGDCTNTRTPWDVLASSGWSRPRPWESHHLDRV